MVGLKVPMVNMVHQYLVTESIPEVSSLQKKFLWSVIPGLHAITVRTAGVGDRPYEMNAEAWDSTESIGVLKCLLPPEPRDSTIP